MMYRMNDGIIKLGNKWADRTVNFFVTDDLPVANSNFVITRDPLPNSVDFSNHIETMLKQFSENLSALKIVKSEKGTINGVTGHFIEMTWIDKGKPLHQVITLLHHQEMLLTMTGTSPGAMDTKTRNAFMAIMSSFKFTRGQVGEA